MSQANKKHVGISLKDLRIVREWAKANSIDLNTVSFYQDLSGEQPDSEFGQCDITGAMGTISRCMCGLTDSDEIYEFSVSEYLIGGALGSLAGAF